MADDKKAKRPPSAAPQGGKGAEKAPKAAKGAKAAAKAAGAKLPATPRPKDYKPRMKALYEQVIRKAGIKPE